jgi:hypothetical protein
MQDSRSAAKASSFPYLVMFYVILVHLLLDALGVFSLLHLRYEHARDMALYMTLGSNIGFLVIYAAFSLAFTQWLLERRRIAGLPGYAPICMVVLSAVLSIGWGFGTAFLLRFLNQMLAGDLSVVVTISVLIRYVMLPVLLWFSIWPIFQLFRDRAVPAAGPSQSRGLALLIFTLFAWSWVMLVLALTVPMGASYFSSESLDPSVLYLAPYAGSFVLALPAFLGALLGLPSKMPTAQPLRMWGVATLAMVVCAVVMVAASFAAAVLLVHFDRGADVSVSAGALVTLVWFAVSTPLCWLSVKLLIRQPSDAMEWRASTMSADLKGS